MKRLLLLILLSSAITMSFAATTVDQTVDQSDSPTTPAPPSTLATTLPPAPTYPPLSAPSIQTQMFGPHSVVPPGISTSCLNQYNMQFQRSLADQLSRAKGQMLSDPTFCPGTTDATLTLKYSFLNGNYNETDVFFVYSIAPIGAETMSSISNCGWQLSAWMSDYNNWRLPIFSRISGCPDLQPVGTGFYQDDLNWYCPDQ